MIGTAEWIAGAAFCTSLAALGSNLILLWLKWPRIVVEVAVRHNDESPGDAFLLTVINNGSEPVTVLSVGLTQRGHGAHRLDYLHTWRGRAADRLPIAHGTVDELVMPLRVVGHGSHVFEYPPSALSEVPPGVRYHGYAKRYRAYRWLPNHPIVRETLSKQTVMRSA